MASAKWNGLVLWSVRARARTAVHGAVGSPLGPSGVLTPARRRAYSGRPFASGRAVCGPPHSAPPRPAERSSALRPPGLRLGVLHHARSPADRTPSRNPQRQPQSGPPDSRHARFPCRRRPPGRSPAECLAVLRAKVRAAAKPPAASYGFRGKRLSPGLEPATFSFSTLNLDHSITGAVARYLFFFL